MSAKAIKANGLELTNMLSKGSPITEINNKNWLKIIAEHFESAKAVAWLDNQVLIGLWNNQEFVFYGREKLELKYVQRLRIFDFNQEIHIWRHGSQWKGRLRTDNVGKSTNVIIAHQLLFGTKGKRLSQDPFIEMWEDRGTKLILPLANFSFDANGNPESRIFIKTHNYLKVNPIGQATYYDCRFVSFTNGKRELI